MCDNHQKPIVASDTPAFFGIDHYGFPEAGEHPADPPSYYPPYFLSERFQRLGYHVEELRNGFYWVTSGGYAVGAARSGLQLDRADPLIGQS